MSAFSQQAVDAANVRAFCTAEKVVIHRDYGIGDIHVRGEQGERLCIPMNDLDRMLDGLGPRQWTMFMLAHIKTGLRVARSHPHLRRGA